MTTLELFKKHRKGEVSRERFLYEVRRDNNLPWITNTTSYNDAVKILKNKGIIRESAVVPENTLTVPQVDRVNPYFLKKGIEKELENKTDLNNNSYEEALNKAANKLAKNAHAFDDLLIHNASEIHKNDEKLQMKAVKNGNHVDKDRGMKKMKGQETMKAQSAPTKENRKGKPKGVKVMPDKGVTGSQKIIKEVSEFIKKSLSENSLYHEFHTGMEVETPHGTGIIKEINGGTLTVECGGQMYDVQMNVVSELMKRAKEGAEQPKNEASNNLKTEGFSQYDLDQIQSHVSTSSALDIGFKQYALENLEAVDSYIEEEDFEEAIMELEELKDALQQVLGKNNPDAEFFGTDKTLGEPEDEDFNEFNEVYAPLFDKVIGDLEKLADQKENEEDYEDELEESGVEFKIPGASSPTYTSSSEAASKEAELRRANIRFTKKSVG